VASSNTALYNGGFLYLEGVFAVVNLVGSSIASDIQKVGGTINVFSTCGTDTFQSGAGTIACKTGSYSGSPSCSQSYTADMTSSLCNACLSSGTDPYACCGASECSPTVLACSPFQESICPDPSPSPTFRPSPGPSFVPTSPTSPPTPAPTPECVAGTYLLLNDDASSGGGGGSDGGVCTKCPIGQYSNHSGAPFPTTCLVCMAGQYNTAEGQPGCQGCPSGKLSSEDRSFCKDCQAGEYSFQNLECKR
jgi:hypothetical protein